MIVGTTLFKLDGTPYYSPPFARGGGAARLSVNATHLYGSPTLTFTIQHKNNEDTSWVTTGSDIGISSTGTGTVDVTGIKEQIRIAVTFDAGDDALDAIHFEIMPPSWRPY